jgi:actin
MVKLLTERGHKFSTSAEREIVRSIKKMLCYVAIDFDREMAKAASNSDIERTHELPNGNVLTVGNECFRLHEMLFKPHIDSMEYDGIDKALLDSIIKCDIDVRKDLYTNIVLSQGIKVFPRLSERIEKEVTTLAPPTMKVKVVAPDERKYAV